MANFSTKTPGNGHDTQHAKVSPRSAAQAPTRITSVMDNLGKAAYQTRQGVSDAVFATLLDPEQAARDVAYKAITFVADRLPLRIHD